jgi:hypothetical protein
MSRDPKLFASELRADATTLRSMADALDQRAADLEGPGPEPVIPSLFVDMDEVRHQAWMRRIRQSEARQHPPIGEDTGTPRLRYIGSALAPTPDYA